MDMRGPREDDGREKSVKSASKRHLPIGLSLKKEEWIFSFIYRWGGT